MDGTITIGLSDYERLISEANNSTPKREVKKILIIRVKQPGEHDPEFLNKIEDRWREITENNYYVKVCYYMGHGIDVNLPLFEVY